MSVKEKIKNARKEITRRKGIAKTVSLIANLTGKPSNNKDQRGFAAEEAALKAAKYWAGEGIIRKARQTERLSPEDMSGTDLVLTLMDGREIKVQVKNHYDFLTIRKCQDGGIWPFIIWPDDKGDIARIRMLNLIFSAYATDLSPFQLRQTVRYILKMKGPKSSNWIGIIFSRFRKVS